MMRWLALCVLLYAGAGCALTSKAQPLTPRYFSPVQESPASSAEQRTPALELRLGEIVAAAHLEERMAYRPSEGELGYYERWRWTEPPQAYLRRALERELFERRGLTRVVSGNVATLSVELTSFEQLTGAQPRVRVELAVLLRGERRALLERTLRQERPLPAGPTDEPTRISQALSLALRAAVGEIADAVIERLAARGSEQDALR